MADVGAYRAMVAHLRERLARTQEHCRRLAHEARMWERSLDGVGRVMRERLEKAEAENERLRDQNEILEDRYFTEEDLRNEIASLETENRALRGEVAELAGRCDMDGMARNNVASERDEAQAEVLRLTTKLTEEVTASIIWQDANRRAIGERDRLEEENARLKVDLADSSAQLLLDDDTLLMLQQERDAATAEAAVLRDVLEHAVEDVDDCATRELARGSVENAHILVLKADAYRAALATPSPAADALLELARAAEKEWLGWQCGSSSTLADELNALHTTVERYQQARREGQGG